MIRTTTVGGAVRGPGVAAAALTKRATRWLLKVALGIELAPPTVQGLQAYAVAKPMLGFVDVLYADDGLRVTRGNRGSLVVTQRVR